MNDKPVSMTSVDSGVETGNDSNDSVIVQHESQQQQQQYGVASNQSTDNNIAIIATGNFNGIGCSNKQGTSTNAKYMFDNLMCRIPNDTSFVPYTASCEKPEALNLLTKCRIPKIPIPKMIAKRRFLPKWYERNIGSNVSIIAKLRRDMKENMNVERADYVIRDCARKLRFAAASNNTTLLKLLLAEGVSPNIPDYYGRTPLHHASNRGHTDIVRLLLTYGADPNHQDCMGNIPLHLATDNHRVAVVTLLLSGGSIIPFDEGQFGLKILGWKLNNLKAPLQSEDIRKMCQELSGVMDILRASADTKENARDQMEILNNACSRLSLSSSDQIQDDIKDLLTNLNDLRITNHTDSIPPP